MQNARYQGHLSIWRPRALAIALTLICGPSALAADTSDPFVSFGEVSVPVATGAAGSPQTNGNYRVRISLGSVGSAYVNSQGMGDEGFGSNVSFLPRVEKTSNGLPFLRAPDGSVTLFNEDGNPSDLLKNDERTLRPSSDGQRYLLTLPGGATTVFSQAVGSSLYPSMLKDPVGNETRIGYISESSPIPTKITSSGGTLLVTFKSEGARITSITDRYGLTTTINYDGAGRLQETKNPDGSIGTSISYASIPGLTLPTTIIDGGRSQTLVSYTVSRDTNAAYVRGVASPNGDIETYAYGPTFAEASGKNRPTVRIEYQDGYMSGLTLNGNRIQTLQRDANGTVLSVTESTGTTRFSYGNGRVTAAYPDGSQSETVRDENQHLISVSVTGSDGQTRTKKYTYAGTVLQNVSISKRGTVTSSQDYHYKDGAPARITTRVTNAVTLDSRGRPAAAVLGDGSDVTIARSTGAITTAVNGSSTTVQCAASPDGGITRQVNGGSGAVRFSLTAQSDASGLQSAWQTTFGNSISRGSRTGAVTLNGSSTTESCENSSSQCETVTSCVPNTFGGCDIQESTTCTQGESTSNPVTSDKPNTDPGYCSTSGANGCNPGYQPQIVQGPGRSTYCTCGRAANP